MAPDSPRSDRGRPPERGGAPAQRDHEEPTELGPFPAIARSRLGKVVLAIVAVAIIAVIIGARSAAVRIALVALLLPLLVYLTVASNRDRRRDEASRRYFERHGRWPSR